MLRVQYRKNKIE